MAEIVTPDWIRDPAHPVVAPVMAGLFGRWEGNWVGWNTAHDIRLPDSAAKGTLPFLMYPNGENGSGRFDELSPDTLRGLRRLVENVSIGAGLPVTPEVRIVGDPAPDAQDCWLAVPSSPDPMRI